MTERLAIAKALTTFLIRWHTTTGLQRVHREEHSQHIADYVSLIERLQTLDPSELSTMDTVVTAQLQGPLERFFGEPLRNDDWDILATEFDVKLPSLKTLGDTAKYVREIITAERRTESGHTYARPLGWPNSISREESSRVVLPLQPGETRQQALSRYFASLTDLHRYGLGGHDLMVSMNEDAAGNRSPQTRDTMEVGQPMAFDFRLVNAVEDDLDNVVLRVLAREIEFRAVMLGHRTG